MTGCFESLEGIKVTIINMPTIEQREDDQIVACGFKLSEELAAHRKQYGSMATFAAYSILMELFIQQISPRAARKLIERLEARIK